MSQSAQEIAAGKNLVMVPCPLCGGNNSKPERTVAGFALRKCDGCSLVFVNPQPPPTAVEDIYVDRDAEHLIAFYAHSHTPAVRQYYQDKLAGFEKLLPQKGKLLDFGCAAGYFTEAAAGRGWDAVGVDLGTWTAEAAARRGFHGIRVGLLEKMGFAPGSFDLINASQVFEHLPDPRGMLKTLSDLLRPGGILSLDVPNYRMITIMLGKDDFVSNEPPQHLNYFTPRTLRKLVEDGGLKTVKVGSGGGLKWENLLGKPITSDVLEAHAKVLEGKPIPEEPKAPAAPVKRGLLSNVKSAIGNGLLRPMFYNRWKVGMRLDLIARKP
jgi:SAM-dependent methyltransferase